MTTTIKAQVTFKGQQADKDFYKIILGGNLNFIINEKDPILSKFLKGYVLTIEVQDFKTGFSMPKPEQMKSIKSLLEYIKSLRGFINLKGVKIIGIEKPTTIASDFDELPDVDDTITYSQPAVGGHLRVVGRV